jgi:hypothetical protein
VLVPDHPVDTADIPGQPAAADYSKRPAVRAAHGSAAAEDIRLRSLLAAAAVVRTSPVAIALGTLQEGLARRGSAGPAEAHPGERLIEGDSHPELARWGEAAGLARVGSRNLEEQREFAMEAGRRRNGGCQLESHNGRLLALAVHSLVDVVQSCVVAVYTDRQTAMG